MLRVYFVRHGETDWNVEGRLQGLTDTPLNAKGLAQANLLAERLAEEKDIIALYTSPLRRAYRTGEIIGGRLDLKPMTDARLVERDMGSVEGLTSAEIEARFPDIYLAWKAGERRLPFPGEETREEFQRRLRGFLQDVQACHTEHKVAVITHGGAMGMIMATVMHLDLERRFPFWFDNASFSIVEFGGPVPRVLALNDTCHLRSGLPHPDEKQEFVLDEKSSSAEGKTPRQSALL
jgi:broad specificity phosphatase PhoE